MLAQFPEPDPISWNFALGMHYATGSADLDDNRHLLGGTSYFELDAHYSGLSLALQSRVQLTDVDADQTRPEHRLRQAYLSYSGRNIDLRLGRQLIIWGRTDIFNPTNNITPVDLRYLTTEQQGQRFGANALNLRWYLSDETSLQFVAVPKHESSILPRGFVPEGVPRPEQMSPDDGFDNPELGVKVEHTGEGFDGSLSVYSGFQTTPGLTASAGSLKLVNPEFTAIGGDFVVTHNGWAFRGEMAFTDFTDTNDFASGVAPEDNLFLVSGVERRLNGDHLLQGQLLYRWIPNHTPFTRFDEVRNRGVALFNDAAYGQFEEHQPGVSASLVSSFARDTLDMELAAASFLSEPSLMLTANMSYQIDRHWTVDASSVWFAGPDESFLGTLKNSSRMLVELKYAF